MDEPDEDLAGELYEVAMARLAGAGYVQYEVSNWAKPMAGEIVDAHSTPDAGVPPQFGLLAQR